MRIRRSGRRSCCGEGDASLPSRLQGLPHRRVERPGHLLDPAHVVVERVAEAGVVLHFHRHVREDDGEAGCDFPDGVVVGVEHAAIPEIGPRRLCGQDGLAAVRPRDGAQAH